MALRIGVIVGCALTLGGCATVTRGTDEYVTFQSEPAGAQMTTSTGMSCAETPCSLAVPRKDGFVATFSKAGYASEQIQVSTRLSGGGAAGLVGNALVGGLIGVGVDAVSGATQDHTPNPVIARLKPLGGPASPRGRARRRTADAT